MISLRNEIQSYSFIIALKEITEAQITAEMIEHMRYSGKWYEQYYTDIEDAIEDLN